MDTKKFNIDIVSDIVCPWCIVGFRRLEIAMESYRGTIDFEIQWRPFELNPGMPEEGQNLRDHVMQKYGISIEQSKAARNKIAGIGSSLGFEFNFDEEMRMYNTIKAHQLLHWSRESGKETELKLQLFHSYFTEQKNISRIDVLVDIAVCC